MDLPNETLLTVLESLGKKDLKASRLVSKIWCACASTFLFAEIYVSSAKEDLEAFEAVTQSPLLSDCVRSLKYDATEFFEGPTKSQYIAELVVQKPIVFPWEGEPRWNTSDSEVNKWVNTVILGQSSIREAIVKFEDITMEGSWPYIEKFNECYTGSYLARHWNRFDCKPQRWRWGPEFEDWNDDLESWKKCPDGSQSYRIIMSAIEQAQTHLTSFSIGSKDNCMSPGLPPILFDTSSYAICQKARFSGPNLGIFLNIERLVLRLSSVKEMAPESQRYSELLENIGGLQLLLESMEHLNHLELILSKERSQPPAFYSNHQVFPRNTIWRNLESFTLMELSITATDLVNFLLYQTPNLKHLEIGEINLLEGTWEGFLEALALSDHLTSFKFENDTYLYHRDGRNWWSDDYPSTVYSQLVDLYEDLEYYMVHGGRHSCLSGHQPNTESRDFLKEFDPMLRQRLLELGASRPERPA